MDKWALVLGGGGAKGAYHLGVWQALSEMSIKVDFISGTSIGAINGAMLCQGSYEDLKKLWSEITIDRVVDLKGSDITGESLFDIKNIKEVAERAINKSGFEMTPLKQLLIEYVDEEKLRNSECGFALVTCKLTDLEEVPLKKEDIPNGRVVDYLMASASLPGLKPAEIDGVQFIDGGVKNNIPIDIPMSLGYKNIILVDVGGAQIIKNKSTSGLNVYEVRASKNLIGMMEFKSEAIKKTIKLGYFDCYKAFARLEGKIYNFNIGDYKKIRLKYSEKILDGLEYAAEILGIEQFKVYKVESFIDGVLKKFEYERKNNDRGEMVSQLVRLVDDILLDKKETIAEKIIAGFSGEIKKGAGAIAYFLKDKNS